MEEMIGRHQKTPGSIIRAVQERFAPNPDPGRAGKNSGKVPRSWRKELEAESRNFRIENFLDRFLFEVENSVEEIGIPESFRIDAGNGPSNQELAISGNLAPEVDSSDLDGKSISEADDKRFDANDVNVTLANYRNTDDDDDNCCDADDNVNSHDAADNVSCCSAYNEVRSLDADADVSWCDADDDFNNADDSRCDADNDVNYCNANNDVNNHDADDDISCCEDTGNDSDTSGVSSWDPSDCELKIFPGTIDL